MVLAVALLISRLAQSAGHLDPPAPSQCRCVAPHPCAAAVPWPALNASVGGRLVPVLDPLRSCQRDLRGTACAAALNATDDEFWLSAQPGGYLHSGQYGRWNVSAAVSGGSFGSGGSFAVAAECEADVQAAVAFAADHNLRLVVKSTGHDWFGRSSAPGSLMVWTHRLSAIAFHAAGGQAADALPTAVTVQAGVQLADLYRAAHAAGVVVMGGTCDSVGVGGCFLGGCFGVFTRKFGSAASNLLAARVVLANGSLVTASATSHADLFWALRGGGGGVAGVVTSFTARAFRAPRFVRGGSFRAAAATEAEFEPLLAEVLAAAAAATDVAADTANDGSMSWGGSEAEGGFHAAIAIKGYEATAPATAAVFAPLAAYVAAARARGANVTGAYTPGAAWNASEWRNASMPWEEVHPDREISTSLLASASRYIPLSPLRQAAGRAATARALLNVSRAVNAAGIPCGPFLIMFAKGQGGVTREVSARFNETSQNPLLLDTIGLLLAMYNIPELPQLPPSSTLLREQWPRLQEYAITSAQDPLWAGCSKGAAGDEAAAVACLDGWHARVPVLQRGIAAVRAALYAGFPNEAPKIEGGGPTIRAVGGAYLNEGDYDDPDFRRSQWGAKTYTKLLRVKAAYDPDGLFVCHHCVGSEAWSDDGNCRLSAADQIPPIPPL
jgi:FAD/FMN-containing dehydrogenase